MKKKNIDSIDKLESSISNIFEDYEEVTGTQEENDLPAAPASEKPITPAAESLDFQNGKTNEGNGDIDGDIKGDTVSDVMIQPDTEQKTSEQENSSTDTAAPPEQDMASLSETDDKTVKTDTSRKKKKNIVFPVIVVTISLMLIAIVLFAVNYFTAGTATADTETTYDPASAIMFYFQDNLLDVGYSISESTSTLSLFNEDGGASVTNLDFDKSVVDSIRASATGIEQYADNSLSTDSNYIVTAYYADGKKTTLFLPADPGVFNDIYNEVLKLRDTASAEAPEDDEEETVSANSSATDEPEKPAEEEEEEATISVIGEKEDTAE